MRLWSARLVVVSVLLIAPSFALAEGMPVEPGLWEFVSSIPDPLGGNPIRNVHRTCVREPTITPARVMAQLKECRIWDVVVRPPAAKWKMRCQTPAGVMSGHGSLRSNENSVAGSLELVMTVGAFEFPVAGTFKGKRVGKCR